MLFKTILQVFIANGFYVLVDYHPHKLESTAHNSIECAKQWAKVWQRIACLPNFQACPLG